MNTNQRKLLMLAGVAIVAAICQWGGWSSWLGPVDHYCCRGGDCPVDVVGDGRQTASRRLRC